MEETKNREQNLGLSPDSLKHINQMHTLGRIGIAGAFVVMLGIPTVMGIAHNAMPGILQVFTAAVGLLALFVPTAISETIAMAPVFGSSYYLAQITGNIMNLKMPVATAALQELDIDRGTEDADIVTAIAVSVSAFTTILIIALGAALLVPLRPVLELPAVKLAAGNIVPALFGGLTLSSLSKNLGGGKRVEGRLKGFAVPVAFVLVVYVLVVYAFKNPMFWALYNGILMLILIPITWFAHKALFKSGQIRVLLPGEK